MLLIWSLLLLAIRCVLGLKDKATEHLAPLYDSDPTEGHIPGHYIVVLNKDYAYEDHWQFLGYDLSSLDGSILYESLSAYFAKIVCCSCCLLLLTSMNTALTSRKGQSNSPSCPTRQERSLCGSRPIVEGGLEKFRISLSTFVFPRRLGRNSRSSLL